MNEIIFDLTNWLKSLLYVEEIFSNQNDQNDEEIYPDQADKIIKIKNEEINKNNKLFCKDIMNTINIMLKNGNISCKISSYPVSIYEEIYENLSQKGFNIVKRLHKYDSKPLNPSSISYRKMPYNCTMKIINNGNTLIFIELLQPILESIEDYNYY